MTRKYRWGFHKCLALLQGKRKCCCPNSGFQKQLIELEGLLGIDSKKEENGKGDINARGKY